MSKPGIAVARAIFPQVIERLQQHFDVLANQHDVLMPPAELAAFAEIFNLDLAELGGGGGGGDGLLGFIFYFCYLLHGLCSNRE